MGISFGSTGIKPYVGSKEVQEAYVGSQLVYKAVPPYKYYFLGGETDYVIDNNALTLSRRGAVIAKDGGIFRIALTTSGSTPGYIATNGITGTFDFIARWESDKSYASATMYINFYRGNTYLESASYRVNILKNYQLITVTIPANATSVRLTHNMGSEVTTYIDAIKQLNS